MSPLAGTTSAVRARLRTLTDRGLAGPLGVIILTVVAGARAGLLAAVVTLFLPEVLDYTRTFYFAIAIATAGLLTASVWALVRSEGLQRHGWSLAAGAFFGGMLLARTMTVGFIPGLGIACALIVAARPRRERGRSAVNLAPAAATAVAVAGQRETWATRMARVQPSVARRGSDGQWLTSAGEAAAYAVSYARVHGVEPIVFLGSRDPLFNTNTVALAGRIRGDWTIPMGQLDPGRGDTVGNYGRQLTDPKLGWPNLLITLDPGRYEFQPPIDPATAERAARDVGFSLVRSLRLPDGRSARFYWLPRGPKARS